MIDAEMLLARYCALAATYEKQYKRTSTCDIQAYRDVYRGAVRLLAYVVRYAEQKEHAFRHIRSLAMKNADEFLAYRPFAQKYAYSFLPDGTFVGSWYEPGYAVAASRAFRVVGEDLQCTQDTVNQPLKQVQEVVYELLDKR